MADKKKIGIGAAVAGAATGAGGLAYMNRDKLKTGAMKAREQVCMGAGKAAGAVRSGAAKAFKVARKLKRFSSPLSMDEYVGMLSTEEELAQFINEMAEEGLVLADMDENELAEFGQLEVDLSDEDVINFLSDDEMEILTELSDDEVEAINELSDEDIEVLSELSDEEFEILLADEGMSAKKKALIAAAIGGGGAIGGAGILGALQDPKTAAGYKQAGKKIATPYMKAGKGVGEGAKKLVGLLAKLKGRKALSEDEDFVALSEQVEALSINSSFNNWLNRVSDLNMSGDPAERAKTLTTLEYNAGEQVAEALLSEWEGVSEANDQSGWFYASLEPGSPDHYEVGLDEKVIQLSEGDESKAGQSVEQILLSDPAAYMDYANERTGGA